MDQNLKANIASIYTRNWPTLIGLFCVLFIWASIASAYAHSYTIVTDPGIYGYLGVFVGMVVSAILLLSVLIAKKRALWLKCESILPPLCATFLVTSRFFFDWQNDLSSFIANSILGFSTLSIVILAFEGIRSEIAGKKSKWVLPLVILAIYGCYFVAVFCLWPLMGDYLGDKIGHTLLIVFLFSVIVNMFTRMQRFDPDETQSDTSLARPESDSSLSNIPSIAARHGLSSREQEVLLLLAQGYSAPYIADKLFISNGTVKTHVARIYQKFGVSKRDELIEQLK